MPVKWDKALTVINVVLPVIGIGLMISYEICDTSCSYLQGSLLGVDLKIVGILFMAVLLSMSLPQVSRYTLPVDNARTMLLSSAVGGEILLVHFQVVHDIFCPFCLAFGVCILILFAANMLRMRRVIATAFIVIGIGIFALYFKGSVLPQYAFIYFFS
jgi:hypothetical protein